MKKLMYVCIAICSFECVPFESQENIKQLEQKVDRAKQKYEEIAREKEQEIKAAQKEVKKYESWIADAHDVELEQQLKPKLDKALQMLENVQAPTKEALTAFNEAQQELKRAQNQLQQLAEPVSKNLPAESMQAINTFKAGIAAFPDVASSLVEQELNKMIGKPRAEQKALLQEIAAALKQNNESKFAKELQRINERIAIIATLSASKAINKFDYVFNLPPFERTVQLIKDTRTAYNDFDTALKSNDFKKQEEAFKTLQELSILLNHYEQEKNTRADEIKTLLDQTIKAFAPDFKKETASASALKKATEQPENNIYVLASNPDKSISAITALPIAAEMVSVHQDPKILSESIGNADKQVVAASIKALDNIQKNKQANNLSVAFNENKSAEEFMPLNAPQDIKQLATTLERTIGSENNSELISKQTLNELNKQNEQQKFIQANQALSQAYQSSYESFPSIEEPEQAIKLEAQRKSLLQKLYEPVRNFIQDVGLYIKNLVIQRAQPLAQSKNDFKKAHAQFMSILGLDPQKEYTADHIEQAYNKVIKGPDAQLIDNLNKSQAQMIKSLKAFKDQYEIFNRSVNDAMNLTARLIVQVGNVAFAMPDSFDPFASSGPDKTKRTATRYLGTLNEMRSQQLILNDEIQKGLNDFKNQMKNLPGESQNLGLNAYQQLSKLTTSNAISRIAELEKATNKFVGELERVKNGAANRLGIK